MSLPGRPYQVIAGHLIPLASIDTEKYPSVSAGSHRTGADEGLIASIDEHGVMQPVIVMRAVGQPTHYLVAGFRRVASCRVIAQRQFLKEIPATIYEFPTEQALDDWATGKDLKLIQFTECTPRRNPTKEECCTMMATLKHLGLSVAEVAEQLGQSEDWVRKYWPLDDIEDD